MQFLIPHGLFKDVVFNNVNAELHYLFIINYAQTDFVLITLILIAC